MAHTPARRRPAARVRLTRPGPDRETLAGPHGPRGRRSRTLTPASYGGRSQVWRAVNFHAAYAALVEKHRDQMKDTVLSNIEEGGRLTGPQVAAAELKRSALFQRIRCASSA
jgi:hypothetical protein